MFNHSTTACESNVCTSFGVLLHAEPLTRNELLDSNVSSGLAAKTRTYKKHWFAVSGLSVHPMNRF